MIAVPQGTLGAEAVNGFHLDRKIGGQRKIAVVATAGAGTDIAADKFFSRATGQNISHEPFNVGGGLRTHRARLYQTHAAGNIHGQAAGHADAQDKGGNRMAGFVITNSLADVFGNLLFAVEDFGDKIIEGDRAAGLARAPPGTTDPAFGIRAGRATGGRSGGPKIDALKVLTEVGL